MFKESQMEQAPVNTVEGLYELIKSIPGEPLKDHTFSPPEADLPSFTLENLSKEFTDVIRMREAKTGYFTEGEDRENYIPAYYDIGLISRACAVARKHGYNLGQAFEGLNY